SYPATYRPVSWASPASGEFGPGPAPGTGRPGRCRLSGTQDQIARRTHGPLPGRAHASPRAVRNVSSIKPLVRQVGRIWPPTKSGAVFRRGVGFDQLDQSGDVFITHIAFESAPVVRLGGREKWRGATQLVGHGTAQLQIFFERGERPGCRAEGAFCHKRRTNAKHGRCPGSFLDDFSNQLWIEPRAGPHIHGLGCGQGMNGQKIIGDQLHRHGRAELAQMKDRGAYGFEDRPAVRKQLRVAPDIDGSLVRLDHGWRAADSGLEYFSAALGEPRRLL